MKGPVSATESGTTGYQRDRTGKPGGWASANKAAARRLAEGDRVVVFWRLEGTHRGTLFGAAAIGRQVSGDSISWLTFHNGLIVEYGVLPDRQQFLRDLAG